MLLLLLTIIFEVVVDFNATNEIAKDSRKYSINNINGVIGYQSNKTSSKQYYYSKRHTSSSNENYSDVNSKIQSSNKSNTLSSKISNSTKQSSTSASGNYSNSSYSSNATKPSSKDSDNSSAKNSSKNSSKSSSKNSSKVSSKVSSKNSSDGTSIVSSENSSEKSSFDSSNNLSSDDSSNNSSESVSSGEQGATPEQVYNALIQISKKFGINVSIASSTSSSITSIELTNEEILILISNLEQLLIMLPTGILADFGISKFVLARSSINLVDNDSLIICYDLSISFIYNEIKNYMSNQVFNSGITVDTSMYNPPNFEETGSLSEYVFNYALPKTSYFVTYLAQESSQHELSEMFIEIINGQNRFVRIDERYPVFHKFKLVCPALAERYPSLNNTLTVQAFK